MMNKEEQAKMIEAFKNAKGCQFVGLTYKSEVRLNKTQVSAIGGSVTKVVSGTFQFNYSYENAVNNRGEKEQGFPIDFVANSLPYGAWVEGQVNKFITHKDTLYLRFYGAKNNIPTVWYFVDGEVATAEQVTLIKEYTTRKESTRQSAAGVTENQVVARSIQVDNILFASINGERYGEQMPDAA